MDMMQSVSRCTGKYSMKVSIWSLAGMFMFLQSLYSHTPILTENHHNYVHNPHPCTHTYTHTYTHTHTHTHTCTYWHLLLSLFNLLAVQGLIHVIYVMGTKKINCESDSTEKTRLEGELVLHHLKAKRAHRQLHEDVAHCKSKSANEDSLTFHLHQSLHTPMLSTNSIL